MEAIQFLQVAWKQFRLSDFASCIEAIQICKLYGSHSDCPPPEGTVVGWGVAFVLYNLNND